MNIYDRILLTATKKISMHTGFNKDVPVTGKHEPVSQNCFVNLAARLLSNTQKIFEIAGTGRENALAHAISSWNFTKKIIYTCTFNFGL